MAYSSGVSSFTISCLIPGDFTSGSRDYYAMIHPDDNGNVGYYAGPITITAESPGELEFSECISAPTSMNQGEDYTATFELQNIGTEEWNGQIIVIMVDQSDGNNYQTIYSNSNVTIGGGNTMNFNTGVDQINLSTGIYRTVVVYDNAPINGGNAYPNAGSCTPTFTYGNNDQYTSHYRGMVILNSTPGELRFTECISAPTSMNQGEDYTATFELQNIGTEEWNGQVIVTVVDQSDGNNYQTIYSNNNVTIGGGNTLNFNTGVDQINLSTGIYRTVVAYDNAPINGGNAFPNASGCTPTFTYGNNDQYTSHYRGMVILNSTPGELRFTECISAPTSMNQGEDYTATFELQNIGTEEWNGQIIVTMVDQSDGSNYQTIYSNNNVTIGGGNTLNFNTGVDQINLSTGIYRTIVAYDNAPINGGNAFPNASGCTPTFTYGSSDQYTSHYRGLVLLHTNSPEIQFSECFSPLENILQGDNLSTTLEIQNAGSLGWTGNLEVLVENLIDPAINQIIYSVNDLQLNIGDVHYIDTGSDQINLDPGNYRVIVNYDNAPINNGLAHPGEGICTPTFTYGSSDQFVSHYRSFEIIDPNTYYLVLNSGISVLPNNPIFGEVANFESAIINAGNLTWSGSLKISLFDDQDTETLLDLDNDLNLDNNEIHVLQASLNPVNFEPGAYYVGIYFQETGSSTWELVSDGNIFLNPLNISILDPDGSCNITNPPSTSEESYAAAQWLCSNGVIDQPQDGDIQPGDPIIKQDLAKVVFLCLFDFDPNHTTDADNFPVPFGDMQDQDNQAYARYGKVLSYLEYGDGYSPFYRKFFNYNPVNNITRGQVCKVLVEAFNFPKDAYFENFSDVDGSDPEYLHIAKCLDLGIINGNQSNFRPDDFATRGEVFIMLHRLMTQCPACNIPEPDIDDYYNPGNYTPANLGNHPSISDANFDQYSKTSFHIPGRNLPLVFTHSYNSYLTELPEQLFRVWNSASSEWVAFRPLGHGWSHSYNSYITKIPGWNHTDGSSQADRWVVCWPGGNMHIYEADGASPTPVTQGIYDEISYDDQNEIFTITKKNQVKFTFEKINTVIDDWPFMLTKIEDRKGNAITITYEPYTGGGTRIKLVSGTAGRQLQFTYWPNSGRIYQVKDPLNRKIQFSFGGPTGEDLLSYKFFEGSQPLETVYNYYTDPGQQHLLKIITLPNGNFIDNQYENRKLTSTTTNDNTSGVTSQQQVSWGLGSGPNPGTSSTVSISGGSSTYQYSYVQNTLGKITELSTPTNDLDDAQYNDPDNPTLPTSITVDGITSTYTYDDMGNVLQITQAQGTSDEISHTMTYTPLNDIDSYTNPRSFVTDFDYINGNLTSVVSPIGTTTMSYNGYGQVVSTSNPEGINITYTYDNYGNIKQINAPLGIISSATYDLIGRIKTSTDPNGNNTTINYYDRDFIKDISDPMSFVTSYNYDANGNLIKITNAKGFATDLTYDYFDWLKSVEFGGDKKEFFYDEQGKLEKIKKPDGTYLNYTYLSKGNLGSNDYATFTYDGKNRLKTISKDGKSITLNYDNLHRITSTNYDNNTINYEYDENSNVTKIIYPGGKQVSYNYDPNDRLISVKDWNNEETNYYYLADGRLEYFTYPNGVSTHYFYDAAGRMDSILTKKGVDIICAYAFEMDPNGNHLVERKTEPFDIPDIPSANITSTYNDDNTIASSGNNSFTFDDNGNLTGENGRTYGWDDHDMLTSISGDISADYEYDGLGHRRKATIDGNTRKFVLDILGMSKVLIENDNADNVLNYYIYGHSLISRIDASNSTRYYHGDFRGSTIAMTDEQGEITHQYQYDAFGAVLQQVEENTNPFKFVGQYGVMEDLEDVIFMRARYYDSSNWRFLSEDSEWSNNLYTYSNNNPIIFFDVNGKFPLLIPIVIAVLAISSEAAFIYGITDALKDDDYEKAENLCYGKLVGTAAGVGTAFLPVAPIISNPTTNEIINHIGQQGLSNLATDIYHTSTSSSFQPLTKKQNSLNIIDWGDFGGQGSIMTDFYDLSEIIIKSEAQVSKFNNTSMSNPSSSLYTKFTKTPFGIIPHN